MGLGVKNNGVINMKMGAFQFSDGFETEANVFW